jgi:O-antigen/teichoic acid export membrane protein
VERSICSGRTAIENFLIPDNLPPRAPVSGVKRNIVANYAGQAWTGLMGLAFIPLYIRYLGMEAYGLIGLFTAMQAWLALLDMGMTPTLNREMARYTAGAHTAESIADLLRTLEVVCCTIAGLLAAGLWLSSGYLARDWLNSTKLPTASVASALSIIAVVIALRFVEGLYRGALYGLQRQVWYNAASAALASIRHGGAVAILVWVSPTIHAFFLWQAVVSFISVIVFGVSVHLEMPHPLRSARFSRDALASVWRFATGLMGITLLSILLTQVDKLLLSRMLSLADFGYYTLAGSVAGILYMLLGPVSQAIYPRMVELVAAKNDQGLSSVYHGAAQLVTVLTVPAVCVLVLYSRAALFVWSGNADVATRSGPLVSALVFGTFLNGLMWMPYQLQLAYGWTSLTLKANAVGVMVLVPALLWVVPREGALGAAWLWVALNFFYVTTVLHFMHRKLLPREKFRWYMSDILLPALGALAVTSVAFLLRPGAQTGRVGWFAFLAVTGLLAFCASVVLADRVRHELLGRLGLRDGLRGRWV